MPPSLVLGLRVQEDPAKTSVGGEVVQRQLQKLWVWLFEGVEGALLMLRERWQLGLMHRLIIQNAK